jgi:hypothetical protein
MRFARKLFVLAVMAFAAMAFGASSASAVEVSSGGDHCTEVILTVHGPEGGCLVEAVTERETEVQAFVSGVGFVTISSCEGHYEMAIGEDGHGYLYNATISSHSGGTPCTRTQCDEADMTKIPWELQLTSTTNMELSYCLRSVASGEGAAGTPCHTDIRVTPNNATGAHELFEDGVTWGSCENLGGGVRIHSHWNVTPSESHPAIVIAP